jgi:hypothetical protein
MPIYLVYGPTPGYPVKRIKAKNRSRAITLYLQHFSKEERPYRHMIEARKIGKRLK